MHSFLLIAADDNAARTTAALMSTCFVAIIELGIAVFIIAGLWKVFVKAGEPGWAAIIPIYNTIILLKICNRPLWWIVLLLIPCVSLVVAIVLMLDLAKAFGKDTGFAIGLILLGFIFIPILGFGSAQYQGAKSF